MGRFLAIAVVVSLALLDARPARACSSECWPAQLVPTDGATVPANLPAMIWQTVGIVQPTPPPGALSLVRVDAPETPLAITLTELERGRYLVVPAAPLVEGVRYTLRDATTCADVRASATFTVGPAAPLPTRLGSLVPGASGVELLEVATAGGSCDVDTRAAYADVAVTLDPEAGPWRDVLLYETWVDGARWQPWRSLGTRPAPGASWTGRGTDRLYATCAPDPLVDDDLPGGAHAVVLRATVPGTTIALEAGTSVDLICPDAPDAGVDAPWRIVDGDPGVDSCAGCASGAPGAAPWLLALLGLGLRRRRAA